MLYANISSGLDGQPSDPMLKHVGGRGFPTIAILNAAGGLLALHAGARSVSGFRATASPFQR